MKPALPMRTKILALCVSCTLLALCLQTLFFQNSASSIIYRQERDASRKALAAMQDEMYLWVKSYENNLIKIYNQTDFTRDLGGGLPWDYLEPGYKRLAYTFALTVFEPAQGVNALYIYTMDNRLISNYRSASTPRINYPEDIYLDPASSNAKLVDRYVRSENRVMLVSSCFNASRGEDLVRFVLKIYSNNVTKKIGYIVCDVDSTNFLRIMEKYVYSDRQIVWLQPAADRPALRLGKPAGAEARLYDTAVEKISAGTWSEQDSRSFRDSVLFDMPQEKYALTAFSLTPHAILEENQKVLTRNMLLIALMVIAVAVVSATLITRSLTTPLTGIVRALKRIKDGEVDLRLTGLRSDEIGALGGTINEMLDQIQQLIAQVYNAKLLLKQAEYKALQAQVNPHFLYNSLDTMSAVAASQQCHTVSTLCQAMANIFRYSIDMQDPLSTIGSEIVHLKNYMYVMNVRMQNSVTLDINVERSLLGQKIPRLTLQPVVENALQHGLKNKHGEKRIAIEGAEGADGIVLSVSDNGVGMDAEEINRKLQELNGAALEKSSSIGLQNINGRIRLLFGEKYGVRVRSVRGEGSTVSLTIPRANGNGEHA